MSRSILPCTFSLFYRDDLELTHLAAVREAEQQAV